MDCRATVVGRNLMPTGIGATLLIGGGQVGLPRIVIPKHQCRIIHPTVATIHQPRISVIVHRKSNPERSLLALVIEHRVVAILFVVSKERMRYHHLSRIARYVITIPIGNICLVFDIRTEFIFSRESLMTMVRRSRQIHSRNLPTRKIPRFFVRYLSLRKGFETLNRSPTEFPIIRHSIPFPNIRPIVIGRVRRKAAGIGTERTGRCRRGISNQVLPLGQVTLACAEIESRLVNSSCCSREGTQQGCPC